MASITRKWKPFVIIGCSHGNLISPVARRAVLDFCDDFKPVKRWHLGDFIDTAAFRSGAHADNDEGESIAPDLAEGLGFLLEYRATDVLMGNHEARLWKFAHSHKAILAYAGQQGISAIEDTCRKLRASMTPYRGSWEMRRFGNYKLAHGYLFSENAARDHAEAHGNIIFAHTHRPAMATGRRDDNATGICVGTLSDIPCMDYAASRRATLGWGNAFVYGYYTDELLQPYLCVKEKTAKEWILPS